MRYLAPLLLALPAVGCVYVSRTPGETDTVEVLDQEGLSVPEAWALTWSENRTCPLGLVCWFPFGSVSMWPDLRSVSDAKLRRLTPRDPLLEREGSYKHYVYWGFLVLPPGTYCESTSRMEIFAAGCPWGFDGAHKAWNHRILARARDASGGGDPDHVRVARLAAVLDLLREDPNRRDFAEMLLKNFERLGVREEAWPDVVRRVNEMTASER
jgi:hypothetical protein